MKKNSIFLSIRSKYTIYLGIVIMSSIFHFYLGAPFRNDHNSYISGIDNYNNISEPPNYIFVRNFYMIFGSELISPYFSILTLNIIILFLINKYILKEIKYLNSMEILLITMPFIFLSFYGKEHLTILIIFFQIFIAKKWKYHLELIPGFIFGLYVRKYWLLINFLFFLNLLIKKQISLLSRFAITGLILVGIIFLDNSFLNFDIGNTREELVESLAAEDKYPINTLIYNLNLFDKGSLNNIANLLISFFLIFLFPFGHITWKFHQIIFCILQFKISTFLLKFKDKSHNYIVYKNSAFITSYIWVLLLFEPDLGSFARHESDIFFLIAFILIQKNLSSDRKNE